MKVYEAIINNNDLFLFYLKDDGEITLVTDPKYPAPSSAKLWEKQTNTWKQVCPSVDRFVMPSFLIKKEDYNEWIADQMLPLIENHIDHNRNDNWKIYNIFIAKKIREEGIEVGMTPIRGYTNLVNESLQKHVNSLLKLKAFW